MGISPFGRHFNELYELHAVLAPQGSAQHGENRWRRRQPSVRRSFRSPAPTRRRGRRCAVRRCAPRWCSRTIPAPERCPLSSRISTRSLAVSFSPAVLALHPAFHTPPNRFFACMSRSFSMAACILSLISTSLPFEGPVQYSAEHRMPAPPSGRFNGTPFFPAVFSLF